MRPAPNLYVDLDGTLCVSDTLWESLVELVKRNWLYAFVLPFWVLKGKSQFKREVAKRVTLDVSSLPVRPEVLDLIRRKAAEGQAVYLATAADASIGEAFAAHLGCFAGVLASDGTTNLGSKHKLEGIRQHAGGEEFDYVGDSSADLVLFAACRQGYFAGPKSGVWRRASAAREGRAPLERLPATKAGLKDYVRALRPHQWAKNALIAVPLIVSHQINQPEKVWLTFMAMVAFSLVASFVYVTNDMLDLTADRRHVRKKSRPFASGALSIPFGIVLAGGLLVTGAAVSVFLVGANFAYILAFYFVSSTLYSTYLKRKIIIDVFVLSGFYTLRILAGAAAIHVMPSEWLLAFSMFIFTSLAMLKRYIELKSWSAASEVKKSGRRYSPADADLFRSFGAASGYAAGLVFALYISSRDIAVLYRRPQVLWLVCPLLLYWLTRLWFLTERRKLMDDPVLFAVTDKASLACGVAVLLLVFFAT